MNDFFAEFGTKAPVWLDQNGPESDIALSTRARLARNLPGFPFPHHASPVELQTIQTDLMQRVSGLPQFGGGWALDLDELLPGQRGVLQEKLLTSQHLLKSPEHRALVLARDLAWAAQINAEDHLRLLAFRAGFAPESTLTAAMSLDAELEQEMDAAFSAEWGYLTASPTNLGTGLRLSTLLHLPGLVLVGEIERVLNALRQLQFSVRGLFGKSSTVRGGLFQISNLVSLGRDEAEIAEDFRIHVGKIITYERSARNQLYGRDHLGIEDMVQRSHAVLGNARIITAQEAFDCLSNIRLGESLGLLPANAPGSLNYLTVRQQTAHLELAAGRRLSGRDKGAARAALLREFFAAQ